MNICEYNYCLNDTFSNTVIIILKQVENLINPNKAGIFDGSFFQGWGGGRDQFDTVSDFKKEEKLT